LSYLKAYLIDLHSALPVLESFAEKCKVPQSNDVQYSIFSNKEISTYTRSVMMDEIYRARKALDLLPDMNSMKFDSLKSINVFFDNKLNILNRIDEVAKKYLADEVLFHSNASTLSSKAKKNYIEKVMNNLRAQYLQEQNLTLNSKLSALEKLKNTDITIAKNDTLMRLVAVEKEQKLLNNLK